MRRFAAPRGVLVSGALLILGIVAWLTLAPDRIGGSARYVTTTGDSMAPRFETGDLALVRPADQYRVGDIVAYRSPLLNTVVLHRIIARDGDRYVLKGDTNDFIDPDRPARDELIGRLWLRVPRAGMVLDGLRTPAIAAALSGGVAVLLLAGTGRRRRRHRRRHDASRPPRGDRLMPRPPAHLTRRLTARQILVASAVVAAASLLLGLVAFTRPTTKPVPVTTPYTERVSFTYRADVPEGTVYPGGMVRTGDPVFLRLVRKVRVTVDYRFAADAAERRFSGTLRVLVRLTSPTGWSRDITATTPTRFGDNGATDTVTLDLERLQSLTRRVETLTGFPAGGDYTVAVVPRVRVTGTLAGQPLDSEFAPALNFQLSALQLEPGGASSPSDAQQDGLTPVRRGSVAAFATAPTTLSFAGQGPSVATARWIALVGLLLAAAGALLSRRLAPADPVELIQARYGHLIVPISGMAHTPDRPPIDVTGIDALAQLAQRSERLILHHQRDETDTYLVDDEGTLYRYQTRPGGRQPPLAPAGPQAAGR